MLNAECKLKWPCYAKCDVNNSSKIYLMFRAFPNEMRSRLFVQVLCKIYFLFLRDEEMFIIVLLLIIESTAAIRLKQTGLLWN